MFVCSFETGSLWAQVNTVLELLLSGLLEADKGKTEECNMCGLLLFALFDLSKMPIGFLYHGFGERNHEKIKDFQAYGQLNWYAMSFKKTIAI